MNRTPYDMVVTIRMPGNGTDRRDLIEIDPLLKFLENAYRDARVEFHREDNAKHNLMEGLKEMARLLTA